MTEESSVPRDKYDKNPLVPIDADRLMAAIDFRGLSVRQTAQGAGERQQTVDFIVQGRSQRCREERRSNLAEVLGVSDAWLGGEDVPPIPGAIRGTALRDPAAVYDVLDENLWLMDSTAPLLPPRYQLEWSGLARRVAEAWRRDIDAGCESAAMLAARYPIEVQKSSEVAAVTLLQRALALTWWRPPLHMPPELQSDPDDPDDHEAVWERAKKNAAVLAAGSPTRQELDEFAAVGARLVTLLLRPWLEGQRALDYAVFGGILDWLRSGGGPARLDAMSRKAWNRSPGG